MQVRLTLNETNALKCVTKWLRLATQTAYEIVFNLRYGPGVNVHFTHVFLLAGVRENEQKRTVSKKSTHVDIHTATTSIEHTIQQPQ